MSIYVSGLLKDALTVYFCQSLIQGWVGVCRGEARWHPAVSESKQTFSVCLQTFLQLTVFPLL